MCRKTTGPTGTNSVDLNAKSIIAQRVERELVTMCAKFDNYFYTRARLTQPQVNLDLQHLIIQLPLQEIISSVVMQVYIHIRVYGQVAQLSNVVQKFK